jgi:hypothetical protein
VQGSGGGENLLEETQRILFETAPRLLDKIVAGRGDELT